MYDEYLKDINVIRTCYDFFKGIEGMEKFNSIPLPKTEYQNNLKKLDSSAPEQFLEELVIMNINKTGLLTHLNF